MDTLGLVYLKKGLIDSAGQRAQDSAAKLGDNPTVRYHLGLAYHLQGNADLARQELRAALDLNKPFQKKKMRSSSSRNCSWLTDAISIIQSAVRTGDAAADFIRGLPSGTREVSGASLSQRACQPDTGRHPGASERTDPFGRSTSDHRRKFADRGSVLSSWRGADGDDPDAGRASALSPRLQR